MSADLSALLAAAKDDPSDMAPRLVLADWLDDHGEHTRAEFVRLQCHPDYRWDSAGRELRARAEAILTENVSAWGLPGLTLNDFRRGLLRIRGSLEDIAESISPALTDAWRVGWVESLSPNDCQDHHLPCLLASPWCEGIGEIDLAYTHVGDRAAELLADCPRLTALRVLDLRRTNVTPAGIECLQSSRFLRGLREILCDPAPPPPQPARPLRPFGGNFTAEEVVLTSDELDFLARPESAASLTVLKVRSAGLDDADVARLFARPWPLLRRLTLTDDGLTDRTARVLAAAALPELLSLELGRNRIGNEGVQALARSTGMPQLGALGLGDNRFTQAGLDALCRSPHRRGLHALDLRGNRVGPGSLRLLVEATFARSLRRVVIDTAFSYRADSECLERLTGRVEWCSRGRWYASEPALLAD